MGSPVCRVCLKDDTDLEKLLHVFEKYDGKFINEKIIYTVNIDIKQGDGLPDKICIPCVQSLETAYSFKRTCEESDNILRSALRQKEAREQYKVIEENNEHYIRETDATSPVEFELDIVKTEYEFIKQEEEDIYETTCQQLVEVSEQSHAPPNRAIDLHLECHDCGRIFKSKFKLRIHWKKEHMPSQLICPNCKKACKTYKALHSHINRKPRQCLLASKMKIEGVGKSRIFHCMECDYSAKKAQSIIRHLVHHTGEKKYGCELCGKAYTQLSTVITHKERAHKTRIMEMTCDLCQKHVVGRTNIYRHKQSHKSNKQFTCQVCKKVLKTRKTLIDHMKRHNNIKDVVCDICSKVFYTKKGLYTHKHRVHVKSFTLYKCNRCSYESIHSSSVSAHKNRHTDTNVPCEICGTFVENMQQLKIHKLRHDNNIIQCMYCSLKLLRRNNLAVHLRRMHGIQQDNKKKI